MQKHYEVPRVEVPGLSEDEKTVIESVRKEMDWYERTKRGMLTAILAKGRPYITKAKPAPKPTKHQRHKAAVKVRSEYLKSVA